MSKIKIAIIGGGPAALTTAFFLSKKFEVTLYEKEKAVGQKFLVAGKGGFNLTNSITGNELVLNYYPTEFLADCILKFDSADVRKWLLTLGVNTFIGTSGRVYADQNLKPIEVLNSIKSELVAKGVKIEVNSEFIGFDKNTHPIIKNDSSKNSIIADYYIFALGGGSWSITGSNQKWINYFNSIDIKTKPFEPSNCGININWNAEFIKYHSGKPLKNIKISCDEKDSFGEAIITDYGLEGNAVYGIIPSLRKMLKLNRNDIYIDLKPHNTFDELFKKIVHIKGNSLNYKKKLNIPPHQLALIKSQLSKEQFKSKKVFVEKLKSLRVYVNTLRPVEEAISTVGGIDVEELNSNFALKRYPNIFTIGEMVDWDAPTGGFLLQACFSMGKYIADCISKNE